MDDDHDITRLKDIAHLQEGALPFADRSLTLDEFLDGIIELEDVDGHYLLQR